MLAFRVFCDVSNEYFDELSEIGEVDEVVLSIAVLGRSMCKRDESAFDILMRMLDYCGLLE